MMITNEKIDQVTANLILRRPNAKIRLTQSLGKTAIKKDLMVFASVEELSELIEDLDALKMALIDEVGIMF